MGLKRKSKRIDTQATRAKRTIGFLYFLLDAKRDVQLSELDPNDWGHWKTTKRVIDDLNEIWMERTGEELITVSNLRTQGRVDKVFRLNDGTVPGTNPRSVLHLPALVAFMRSLEGTAIGDQIKTRLEMSQSKMNESSVRELNRLEKKFIHVSKGEVQFHMLTEIVDDVIDALIQEKYLSVELDGEQGIKTHVLRPLAILWMNSSLYLAAQRKGDLEISEAYTYAIDGFLKTKILKDKFAYPEQLDLRPRFQNGYGLMSDDSRFDVTLAFDNYAHIRRALRYRKLGDNQKLTVEDDRVILRFTSNNQTELVSWILGWSDVVEVLEPRELREAVAERLRAALSIYSPENTE